MKRTRSSPDPQLDPTSLQGYSESFINNIPEQELDLDLDRGFLGMNLESPLKRKRTDPDLMLEPDQQTPACGGPGICFKDFCFKCL
ncbi:hypothetical protein BGZ68_005804 [Mortierella alpina]|nr:hypothetical protein BGZ68_005804 [Mortierella alpina]